MEPGELERAMESDEDGHWLRGLLDPRTDDGLRFLAAVSVSAMWMQRAYKERDELRFLAATTVGIGIMAFAKEYSTAADRSTEVQRDIQGIRSAAHDSLAAAEAREAVSARREQRLLGLTERLLLLTKLLVVLAALTLAAAVVAMAAA
jgi:hypothetical protein